jgi:uncharacterized protein (DUF2141 family)
LLVALACLALGAAATGAHAGPLACQGARSPQRLIVAVEGVRSSDGFVVGELYGADRSRFLIDHRELVNWRAPAEAGTTTLCLYLAAPGLYEVVVYHDANANGRIDKDLIGRPKEAYGFSNNVRPVLRKPSLESVRFLASPGDTLLHIRLLYP